VGRSHPLLMSPHQTMLIERFKKHHTCSFKETEKKLPFFLRLPSEYIELIAKRQLVRCSNYLSFFLDSIEMISVLINLKRQISKLMNLESNQPELVVSSNDIPNLAGLFSCLTQVSKPLRYTPINNHATINEGDRGRTIRAYWRV